MKMVPKMRAELLADDNDTAAAWERDATKRMGRPAENFIVVDLVITNRLNTSCAIVQCSKEGAIINVNRSCWTHSRRSYFLESYPSSPWRKCSACFYDLPT